VGSGTYRFMRRHGVHGRWQSNPLQAAREVRVHDDDLRLGVADHVLQLGRRVRHRKGDRDPARAPDAPLGGDVAESRRREEGDPCLGEVGPPGEEAGRDAGGRVEQLAIGERAIRGGDGGAVGVRAGTGDEGELRPGSAGGAGGHTI